MTEEEIINRINIVRRLVESMNDELLAFRDNLLTTPQTDKIDWKTRALNAEAQISQLDKIFNGFYGLLSKSSLVGKAENLIKINHQLKDMISTKNREIIKLEKKIEEAHQQFVKIFELDNDND